MSPSEEEDIQQDDTEKIFLVKINISVPPAWVELVNDLSVNDGIRKAELYRQALYHGLSHFAERSNKIRVNKRLNRKQNNNE